MRPLPATGWANAFPSTTRIGAHYYATVLVTMFTVSLLKTDNHSNELEVVQEQLLKREIRKVTPFGAVSVVTAV
jgi:hypothetical protein